MRLDVSSERPLFVAAALLTLTVPLRAADDDGPVVGTVIWKPGLERDANDYDKTDFWSAIAYSPSTGKFGHSCNWRSDTNASRDAREKCDAPDARTVVMCSNGWSALALGDDIAKWGVGWGEDREAAERFALQNVRAHTKNAKVVFSINAREIKLYGSIAFSASTGRYGYASGGGRSAPYQALEHCKAPDAKVLATKFDGWLALAVGDDNKFGYGFAGNRADAERHALDECSKRTRNAKLKVSFCSNGVEIPLEENPRPPSAVAPPPKQVLKETPPDVPALIKQLRDPEPSKRITAAAELGRLGAAARSAVPALREAASSPDVNLRAVAQSALMKIDAALKGQR